MTLTPLATVLLDPPTTLMAGAILGLICWKLIGRAGMVAVWRGVAIAAAWSVIYALSVGWEFFFRADWMFVYLTDTSKVPLVPAYVGFLVVCTGFGVMGYLGVAVLLHLRKMVLAWGTALSSAASLVLCILLTSSQYGKVGTYAQYVAGNAPELQADSGIQAAMLGSTIVIAVTSFAIIALIIRRTITSAPPSPTA